MARTIATAQDHRDGQGEVFATVQAAQNHGARIAHELRHDAYQGCAVSVTDADGNEVGHTPVGGAEPA